MNLVIGKLYEEQLRWKLSAFDEVMDHNKMYALQAEIAELDVRATISWRPRFADMAGFVEPGFIYVDDPFAELVELHHL